MRVPSLFYSFIITIDYIGVGGAYRTIVFPLKLRSLSGSFLITSGLWEEK
jgi:hypothetical protein